MGTLAICSAHFVPNLLSFSSLVLNVVDLRQFKNLVVSLTELLSPEQLHSGRLPKIQQPLLHRLEDLPNNTDCFGQFFLCDNERWHEAQYIGTGVNENHPFIIRLRNEWRRRNIHFNTN